MTKFHMARPLVPLIPAGEQCSHSMRIRENPRSASHAFIAIGVKAT